MPDLDVSELLRSVAAQAELPDLLDRVERGVRRRRQRRALGAVAAVVLVVAGTVAGVVGVRHENRGGTVAATGNSTVLLSARTLAGQAPSPNELEATARILSQRLHAAGISVGTAAVVGQQIRVTAPTADLRTVNALTGVASLRFRQVLEYGDYRPSGTASGGSSPVAGGTASLADSESPTLTTAFVQSFDNWNCAKNPDPTGGNDAASDYIIGCDNPGIAKDEKYLLAPAALEGSDLRTASAGLDTNGNNWVVNLTFSHSGAAKWLTITKKTYEVDGGQPGTNCSPPTGCNAIGITLDGQVESAPYTETDGIPGGQSQITGSFDQQQATNLADILKYGALPLRLAVSSVS